MFDWLFRNKDKRKKEVFETEIWLEGFGSGFSKAFDLMQPFIKESVVKLKEQIENQAIDDSLKRVESLVEKRINDLREFHLKTISEIEEKRQEIVRERAQSLSKPDQDRRTAYLEVLDWVLGVSNGNKMD